MADWDSAKYLEFVNERTQPAIDLANRIHLDDPGRILDIGCGPGNSSAVLAGRFPKADILGVDNSPAMIESARDKHPEIRFQLCDAARDLPALPGGYDVVFSNACIQWIPDHPRILQEMMGLLSLGGVLAVQTPMNYQEPIHLIIGEVSTSRKWAAKFDDPRIFHNLEQGEYFELLSGLATEFTLWQTSYFHVMSSHEDIMEWYRGTGLRPYLNALPDSDKRDFEADIYREIVKAYPVQRNGQIIFRFPRFFFTATR